MSDYGIHPTRYCSLNQDTLYSMYRESVYSKLSESEKLDLLQETVNRDAAERGELGAPFVQFSSLPSNESGNTIDGVIKINYNMAVNGVQLAEYKGQVIQHQMDDYNIQALNTVLHENAHCFQDQVIDGTISISDRQLVAEYQANNFTTSAVLQNGDYHPGSQYLTGETVSGYYLYYFQSTERDAFLSAEEKTDNILQGVASKYGTEASFEAYGRSVSANGYQATEEQAVQFFQNPDFVRDLNQTLQNQYFGTDVPVNSSTENAVKSEMVESYRVMHPQLTQENESIKEEKNNMEFDPEPTTLEEYNLSLREDVQTHQGVNEVINFGIDDSGGESVSSFGNSEEISEDSGADTGGTDISGIDGGSEGCNDGMDI